MDKYKYIPDFSFFALRFLFVFICVFLRPSASDYFLDKTKKMSYNM